jgi:hypothetical protein
MSEGTSAAMAEVSYGVPQLPKEVHQLGHDSFLSVSSFIVPLDII